MTDKINDLCLLIEKYNTDNNGDIVVKRDEPMSLHTSFKIGGAAELFIVPDCVESLRVLCGMIRELDIRCFFLGNGTNILVSDKGFSGAVVSLSGLRGINCEDGIITAEAGLPLITVCKTARDNSLEGLEFAYGIPGSVGGAVYMNAGAYGGEIGNVLKSSTYLDLTDMSVRTIPLEDHAFGYRDSVYKHNERVILSASFALGEGNADEIGEKMTDIMNRRISKQPLEYPSAGSVFKRCEGHFTGQMIEELGLKGYTVGGAQISEKHAGFIINRGGATASDVEELVAYIKARVAEAYGLDLQCEIIRVE